MESFAELGDFGGTGWNVAFLEPPRELELWANQKQNGKILQKLNTCIEKNTSPQDSLYQTAWHPELRGAVQPELEQSGEMERPVCGYSLCEITLAFFLIFIFHYRDCLGHD